MVALASAVCTVLSAAGLGAAFLVARRRRYAPALRIAALALLPAGLAMTGVVEFVIGMTVDPVVWAGFGVLSLSALLFLGARLADRARRRKQEAAGPASPAAPAAGRSSAAPALPAVPERGGTRPPQQAAGDADDFSDIEAILKKHGI